MGDNDANLVQSLVGLYNAGMVSRETVMRAAGVTPIPSQSPLFRIGDTLQLPAGAAVVTRYDPANRVVEIFTSQGESLQLDDAALAGIRPTGKFPGASVPTVVDMIRNRLMTLREAEPAAEPEQPTVTRERCITLD